VQITSTFSQTEQAQIIKNRRHGLSMLIGHVPVLIQAGYAPARNYRANTYPLRVSSHFLYFCGLSIEGATCLIYQNQSYLILPDLDKNDDLWHGPSISHKEIYERCLVDRILTNSEQSSLLQSLHISESSLVLVPFISDKHPHTNDVKKAIVQIRLRHDAFSQHELKRAARISTQAHRLAMQSTRTSQNEADIFATLEYVFAQAHGQSAYQSIVTTQGEVLHQRQHTQPLKPGSLLLVDAGAETDTGYASDVTRTWPVSGHFSSAQKDIYQIVLNAQEKAIKNAKPGMRYRDLHIQTCLSLTQGLVDLNILKGHPDNLVEQGVHALFFPHGLGHLLGLDVHDMEDLGDIAGYAPEYQRSNQFGLAYLRLDRILEKDMALTIEPGLYFIPRLLEHPELKSLAQTYVNFNQLAHFKEIRGIRIEDDLIIQEQAPEVLTKDIPKTIQDIQDLLNTKH